MKKRAKTPTKQVRITLDAAELAEAATVKSKRSLNKEVSAALVEHYTKKPSP